MQVDFSQYNNSWYDSGGGILKRILWYYCNVFFIKNAWFPFNGIKIGILRLFGAQIGKGVLIKPSVNIKYPWNLRIGNQVWIGEEVWIDNLAQVEIGDNVCISQGAMLLCGNHNYKKKSFDLMIGTITLKDGCWVGARTTVCPGVTLHEGSILTVGSIAIHDLETNGIYQGNPATKIRTRKFEQ